MSLEVLRVGAAFAMGCAMTLVGCSPVSRLQVRVIVPSGTKLALHVTGAKVCPPGAVAAPAPATTWGDAEHVQLELEIGAVIVTAAFRGKHCNASVTAWIDADGDGKPSSGDFVGSTPAVEIRDKSWFSNLTRGPDLSLRKIP